MTELICLVGKKGVMLNRILNNCLNFSPMIALLILGIGLQFFFLSAKNARHQEKPWINNCPDTTVIYANTQKNWMKIKVIDTDRDDPTRPFHLLCLR